MIGRLLSGEVVVDRHRSHLHAGVEQLLPEALARIDARGRQFLVEEVVFDHFVGETVCVPTTDADKIVWAKRPNRFGHSRFVKNRQPDPCNAVTIILKQDDQEDGLYVLITAFVGSAAPPEPWDRNATAESGPFWTSHALVWGGDPTLPGTEITECPW